MEEQQTKGYRLQKSFPWILRKLILQEKFCRHTRKNVFLCDAIDLKQSVEGTLKVLGKSLKSVLDEAHFIVNLYSLPLPLVHQANPSFPKVSHLPLSGRTTSKTPPPLETSAIALVYIFFSNLSHS